jgi:hypothetical protein
MPAGLNNGAWSASASLVPAPEIGRLTAVVELLSVLRGQAASR